METQFANEDVQRVIEKLITKMQNPEITLTPNRPEGTTPLQIEIDEEFEEIPMKSKTVTSKEFIEKTLARMNNQKLKTQEKLKTIEEVTKKNELAELKKKPEISKASQKLGKRDDKVYDRVEKDMTESKKAMERIKEKLEKERNDKIKGDLTFTPKLIKPNKSKKRTKEEFFQYNMDWVEKTSKKKEKKKQELEGKLKVDLKFTPGLDNNSISIVQSLGTRKKIEDRLLETKEFKQQKLQSLRSVQTCSFIPFIHENSRILAKNKVEGDVFDRLYSSKRDLTPTMKSEKVYTKSNKSLLFSNDIESEQDDKLDFLFDLSLN